MLLNVDQVVQTSAATLCTPQTLVCIWSGVPAARYHTNRNIFGLSRFALCVCVCASRLGHVMVCASRNGMIWILGDCRCQSLEASFLPELLGRTKTNWNWPHSRSAACCGAEDMSSRAGFSSCASTYERLHTRCAEINELSGRNGIWSLLLQLLSLYHIIILYSYLFPAWKSWNLADRAEVQEVMKQKVRAVSSNFGCHKAGGRKDQSLHSDVNWQLF